ncbi:hypothetical protein SU69_04500 [Thermosipho melanesiensis]|uniref:DUF5723 domain-containing protein n=2 Tax=Thermosipho melanesiensis TaxID=46541 RepID=A6LLE0_THEM4|nr:hypothetical protein [Thermosipho melanesiensis]ABR30741.1 hypothetical protein Tmel_0880 [Thermosipho melanesiensis BI429]APT74861.1 hypothetical protein BW47_04730 [Thermosipho melanesiensis]OOC35807.1 hypothetical protein SU68_04555 [Thermosipho melanesiensis]OOC38309.1 hypothetical protein SU69_04500 [Thermosipho melanesiensis]OOC38770.1 hypothetical protein SU70_04500 [Thermosipho melanesiensis]
MKKIILFLIFITIVSFPNVINPFDLYRNDGIIFSKEFYLISVNFSGNLLFNQDILSAESINKFFGEQVINLNEINNLSANFLINSSVFGTLKLGNFAVNPYVYLNGNIDIFIPEQIKKFLIEPTLINSSYKISEKFLKSNVFLDTGIAINLGNFFISPSVFLPVLYTSTDQVLYFNYSSSASPANANLDFHANATIYTALPFENTRELEHDNFGISYSFGLATKNFGISINNIQIKPAIATYKATLLSDFHLLYLADGTNITTEVSNFEATLTNFENGYLEISRNPEITVYLKTHGTFSFGTRGKYVIDDSNSNWNVGIFGEINFHILKTYYALDYLNLYNLFAHNFGTEINLHFLYLNINLKSISHTLSPFDDASFGLSVNLGFGI